MADPARCLFFDFVDPLSYLTDLAVREIEATRRVSVARVGVELRPPPAPLTDALDPFWAARCEAARIAAPQARLAVPALVPWSRKAHELHAFAEERGMEPAVRSTIFDAYVLGGRDIGRIDVLIEIAAAAGLDRTETKAALDVDRFEERVAEARRGARELGVVELPAILVGGRLVQGFHNLSALGTLLGGSP
jgi:2-hydroxychromene-2-carboxylate isomerase